MSRPAGNAPCSNAFSINAIDQVIRAIRRIVMEQALELPSGTTAQLLI